MVFKVSPTPAWVQSGFEQLSPGDTIEQVAGQNSQFRQTDKRI